VTGAPRIEPRKLGDPCWDGNAVVTAIRIIAQVDPSRADWFLASHAPIRHLLDAKADQPISEVDAFASLIEAKDREVEVIVKGEPGTGKSHLVNWLKLRYDDGLRRGEISDVLPILIQRRSGSLKDALDQLVSQLPEQFAQYLDPIKAAISSISSTEARERLAHFISQELGVRWVEAERPSRDRRLRALDEVFMSTGFRQWLCRDGGAIAANIRRLTSPSNVLDRESVPLFTETEFYIGDAKYRRENTPSVIDLIHTLDDDLRWRQEAANCVNGIVRDAVRRMTGLGDRQLTEIFRRIRTDLRALQKRLVLFIEDVSTLSVLDNEILNALEPQNDSAMCPLTSVIGMTFGAYSRLRDNEKQRATFVWSLGSSRDSQWRSNSSEMDRFVGRYLNTVRLAPKDVRLVAEQRLAGSDVGLSACEGCRIQKSCHTAYGAVSFGETVVGLFPLRPGSAGLLLDQLDQSRDGIERTPRGLLINILEPLLEDVGRQVDGLHATLKLPVRLPQPSYWTAFENQFCGDWTPDERNRARMLAVFWAPSKDEEGAAAALAPLLQPFGLPAFGRAVRRVSEPMVVDFVPKVSPGPDPTPPKKEDPVANVTLEALRARLEAWISGDKLTTPRDCQELLLGLIKNALPLEDAHRVRRSAHRLIREATTGSIWLEDVMTRAATVHFGVKFPRSHETMNLILALANFKHVGENSWAYADAEIHKRIVSTWVRKHGVTILATLDEQGVDPGPPMRSSARFLSIAFMAFGKHPLPLDYSEAIEALIKFAPTQAPMALSKSLSALYGDLPVRVQEIKAFLQLEMDVPQGSGGTLFIDPTELLNELPAMRRAETPEPLGGEYLKGYSQSRYSGLRNLIDGPWRTFGSAIDEERECIARAVDPLITMLAGEGLDVSNLREAIGIFIDKALEVRRTVKDTAQVIPCPAFDNIVPKLGLRREVIGRVLVDAYRIGSEGGVRDVLCFDAAAFDSVKMEMFAIAEFISMVRRHVAAVTANVVPLEDLESAQLVTESALETFLDMVHRK
jgi:hypothetical protein